ncbi:hypothetical protein SPRG_11846 [Saprolegnia parasitica CBS 223.65]|uniref:Uncharacterized protein n=1 Tax=Saprolegnia parasitica (strain CBS 223.65) TaxID=695850 RepID=A0A067C8W2_SAPPC|nr:hypothetical protein SPRG_11846 [Saprolegnia parasitica CBS 223.65]KDO23001.1 hypothetical protein SPRG_11846 [Saprolegnia parasitica CBS 223.65]|eukprot:XP_012206289.1 hypothetical protein SPRG_11846 [Saprolegnia parasitica CBS 223.65]
MLCNKAMAFSDVQRLYHHDVSVVWRFCAAQTHNPSPSLQRFLQRLRRLVLMFSLASPAAAEDHPAVPRLHAFLLRYVCFNQGHEDK